MVFAKKSLGQNFLMHARTAERIVAAARLPEGATVLEIGPGTGMLTNALLGQGVRVVAVEADDALAPELEERFAREIREGKLQILHGDIRAFDPTSLASAYHIVANIPYYITGEIIRKFLTASHKPQSMTVLVQKEVAERIARNNGKESLLSLSIKAFGQPEYCFTVPKGAFKPAPKVDSAVLSIQNISPAAFNSQETEGAFFTIIRAGFAHKRKRLAKNLEDVAAPGHISEAFSLASLHTDVRPEDLTIGQWLTLSTHLFPGT